MCVCARFLSRHVCTRLLTYTVYSWLGCEPGALKCCVAFPHRLRTPTTRGHSLCLRNGSWRWDICCFLERRFARPHFSFYFFNSSVFNFSTPLSFNSFLRFSFLLSWFLPLETQIHTEQKSGREREGASVVIDQLFAAPTAAPVWPLSQSPSTAGRTPRCSSAPCPPSPPPGSPPGRVETDTDMQINTKHTR